MNCINCNGDNAKVFFEETLTCGHCNKLNTTTYMVCTECGVTWVSVNGQPEAIMDLDELLGPAEDIVDNLSDIFEGEEETDFESATMEGLLHRCLRCHNVAYETAPNNYRCPACDFEWEVL